MIARIYDNVLRALFALAGLLIVGIMVSVTIDVVGRYFLGRPVGWVLEAVEYTLLFIPFLGMAWLVRKGGHVRIDVVLSVFGRRTQAAINSATAAGAAIACGVAAYWAALTTWDHFDRAVTTIGIYPISKYLPIAVIALGFAFTCLEFARQAYEEFRAFRNAGDGRDGEGQAPPS